MNSDHENAKRHLNSFVILKKLSLGMCAVALVVGVVLMAVGNSNANGPISVAALMFILSCVFSNAAGHFSNALSIIDLQQRLSELESGSPKESESAS